MKRRIVLCSDNRHKLEEFRKLFSELLPDAELVPLRESGFSGEIIENGDSFEQNAFLKANTVRRQTGDFCIADDSGLEVDALDGAPGIYSARYAGEHGNDEANIQKLLSELKGVPAEARTARFVCCICAIRPDGENLSVVQSCEGTILDEMRGDGRFGYDPVFFYEPFGKTFAELDGIRKNEVSHRGKAMKELAKNREFFLK